MSAVVQRIRKEETVALKLDTHHAIEFSERRNFNRGRDAACTSVPFGGIGPTGRESAQSAFAMTANESERFLSIIRNVSEIRHHYELFLLLQGNIQHFISHQIFLAAWGDFRDSKLTLDVVSGLPGVRTAEVNGCGAEVENMLKDLHKRWIDNGRRKMLLGNGRAKSITSVPCDCALHKSMRTMQSILVHGVRNERDQTDSIYVALDPGSVANGRSIERFFPLADPLIVQIDAAFQKVGALNVAGATEDRAASSGTGGLSVREREIIKWVAEGRTNAEIGEILGISSFTVKNHVQKMFKKLKATNRTEAVSKCIQHGFAQ